MFVLFIAMMVALHFHDDLSPQVALSPPHMLMMATLPRLAAGLVYLLLCRVTLRRLAGPKAGSAMRWLQRLGKLYLLVVLALFINDLQLGMLVFLRQVMGGNWILLDEIAFLLPSLLLILWSWWCYFPIDRRLREATLMSRLDTSLSPPTFCTRWQYILGQLRHQVAIVLIPLLLLFAWSEILTRFPARIVLHGQDIHWLLALAGAGAVLLFSPVMLRFVWDTRPLPAGELRQALVDLCMQHRVRVRQLLLWRTHGQMINAAVMGMISPLRYILLTDALLENVPHRQVEAVMAHEIGHVRRRHLLWLIVAAAALLMLWELLLRGVLLGVLHGPMLPGTFGQFQAMIHNPVWLDRSAMVGALLLWFFSFGWVSRRFERQADTFAVQHLSLRYGRQIDPARGLVVDPQSADAMILALQQIADLNHIPVERESWRHGSIRWRQDYLQGLVGRPVQQLPIDELMLLIKAAAAVILGGGIIWEILSRMVLAG